MGGWSMELEGYLSFPELESKCKIYNFTSESPLQFYAALLFKFS